ncbi:hypothetical protein DFJ73DRAFT_829274 [Zopfochytrium polystomum]|nr:hypothetical protein DFJ73DRAFT_829274 [Zopfochytrium polystomum]
MNPAFQLQIACPLVLVVSCFTASLSGELCSEIMFSRRGDQRQRRGAVTQLCSSSICVVYIHLGCLSRPSYPIFLRRTEAVKSQTLSFFWARKLPPNND